MKKQLACIAGIFLLTTTLSAQITDMRHQFWVSGSFDYYFNKGEIELISGAYAPLVVPDRPGFRVGFSYTGRPFKKFPGYITLDAQYGRQWHASGFDVDANRFMKEHLGIPVGTYLRHKRKIDFFPLMLGYEQRIPLGAKTSVNLFVSAKAGVVFALPQKNPWIISETYIYPVYDSVNQVPVGGLYVRTGLDFNAPFMDAPIEISTGAIIPFWGRMTARVFISYGHTLINYGVGGFSGTFRNVDGLELGHASYSDTRRYFSAGIQLGISPLPRLKVPKESY